jgi:uncharacterized membrane protein YhaH (DUF805 family)
MSFGEAIASCFSNYAGFNGRARRSEYWYWQLFLWLVILVGGALVVAFGRTESGNNLPLPVAAIGLVFGLFFLGTFLPSLAVAVRRLHDINCSGWLLLLHLIPYLGALAIFVMSVLPGTRGENAYGPDSRRESMADVF